MEETTSKLPAILEPTNNDIALMLAAKCHLGSKNVSSKMKNYVFSRRADGVHILHIGKTWEKLMLAARILAMTQPEDIYITFSAVKNRRPAIKLAQYLGANCNQDRFVPGTFTNMLVEPTLLVSMDPSTDRQAIIESCHCMMPVIAFANSHCSLKYIDIAIPCNNLGAQSIGVMSWLLARAVLRLHRLLNYVDDWSVLPDMFFYSEDLTNGEEDYGEQADALGYHYGHEGQQASVSGVDGEWGANNFGTQNEIQFEGNTSSWKEQSFSQLRSYFDTDQQEHQSLASIDWAADFCKDDDEQQLPVEEGWGSTGTNIHAPGFNPSKNLWGD